ncbi:hypothetical protein BVC80_1595g23 [Macleaya cordata]|uniref:DUF6821 domain-containing protein n=1 Tax=Macleaya cordata TaxID=56857 RepID=A0A200QI98_MACCD|nr:hypothetical protein BVC80_1595g23 [Macleaya cordata]
MEEIGEFQDWELLHNSDNGAVYSPKTPDYSRDFGDIEGDSEGVIRSDYFALDSEKRYARTVAESDDRCSDEGSVKSDNPSWLDPCSDDAINKVGFQGIAFERKNSGEFWSDSGSDGSVTRKFAELEEKHELGLPDDEKRDVVFEGIEKNEVKITDSGEFWSDSSGKAEIPVQLGSAGGGGDLGVDNVVKTEDELGISSVSDVVAGNISEESVNSGEGEKRGMVWWKLPLELLKFCVFRVSPVWSFSIAAAVVGFVILRRRLHKMKRKSQSIALKVTVEDKKVSQFMTRATRLNEAFSVVKRAPMIRPSLPAGGVTPWPVMSLR